jgi:phenylpropionate dioxygenase-like ring-hydroxylating dioxygenase large terminal subunit
MNTITTAHLLLLAQIRDPEKEKAACASPRACVSSFPTTVVEGMLFAWLESGPEAEKEAAAQQPYIMPEQVRSAQLIGWCCPAAFSVVQ